MPKRVLGVVVTALIAAAVGTAPAVACDTAEITPGSPASPGDTVPWTAAGLEPGASYEVWLSGTMIASGTSDGTAVRGTFTMPPREGSAKGVSIQLNITDDDFANGDPHATRPGWTAYQDAPAPARDPQPETSTGQAQTASPQSAAPPAPRSRPSGGATGATHTLIAREHRVTRHVARPAAPTAVARRVAAAPAAATPAPLVADSVRIKHVARFAARAIQTRAPAPTSPPVRAAAPASRPSLPSLPIALLVAIAAVAVGGSLLGLLVRRRRPGDDAPVPLVPAPVGPNVQEAMIEAELQELLAEEEARAIAADARGAPVGTGAPEP